MDTNKKLVIVINGKGGVGKDALCASLAERYKVKNISAITPIKEIASQYGWNGEKDDRSRRFLSELKRIFADYNDLPTRYLVDEYKSFLESDGEFLCVHIREKEEIEKFISAVTTPVITLLVTRRAVEENHVYGNASDDDVDKFEYDFTYANDAPLCESSAEFVRVIGDIFDKI